MAIEKHPTGRAGPDWLPVADLLLQPPPSSLWEDGDEAAFLPEQVEDLARLLLSLDPMASVTLVNGLRRSGVSLQHLSLNLLAPASRVLGRLWVEDRCSFAEVTLGMSRLHQMLHGFGSDELRHSFEGWGPAGNTVLLACLPGEQHTFGSLMVSQFLRRDGWDVRNEYPADEFELIETVKRHPFTIIGLSIGRESRLDEAAALIKALRRASKNRGVAMMVGGPVIALRPQLVRELGADVAPLDAQEAARWAQRHWQAMVEPA